jgi:hypothetical protein
MVTTVASWVVARAAAFAFVELDCGPRDDDRGSAVGDLLSRLSRGVRYDEEELLCARGVLVCLRCRLVEVVLLDEDCCDGFAFVFVADGVEAVS